jgi:hypothetical protein
MTTEVGAVVDLTTIKASDHNPRRIKPESFDRLCESIKRDPQFMALRPIVVDEGGVILGGNQRYRACRHLGLQTVPASWVMVAADLTPEQRHRFMLVDNAPDGMSGSWDVDALTAGWSVPDLGALGFDELLADLKVESAPVQDRAGASPWDRVGDAAPGVMFSFGDIQCRVPVECYEKFQAACPASEVASWVEGVIRACANR